MTSNVNNQSYKHQCIVNTYHLQQKQVEMTLTRLESPVKEVALHQTAKTKHPMFRKKPLQQGQEVQMT